MTFKTFLAALGWAVLALAPGAAGAQTISGPGGVVPGQAVACDSVASVCLNLTNGGSSTFSVSKTGDVTLGEHIYFNNVTNGVSWDAASSTTLDLYTSNVARFRFSVGLLTATAGFSIGATAAVPDVFMVRDAANTLALRNGTNPQSFRIYNTYTDSSNGEWAKFRFNANVLEIGTAANGTGTQRSTSLTDAKITMPNLPTSDPGVAGQLWNNAGVLSISAG